MKFNRARWTLLQVRARYKNVAYHNFRHCFDVTQTVFSLINKGSNVELLQPIDRLAIMLSAVVHDCGHPGLNNNFHVNKQTNLALLYNDASVLENYHVSLASKLMGEADSNILADFEPELKKALRKSVIACVLSTDMSQHFDLMNGFKAQLEVGQWEGKKEASTREP